MARVISVSNHKGGVGKTTIISNLGFSMARYFKVLLIDMDPQANLTMGLGYKNNPENIAKYFKDMIHFRTPEINPCEINKYVHLIPGSVDMLKIETQLHETLRSQFVLKEMLIPLKRQYDLIFIDCPPSFNLLTLNSLYSSNLILIPAKPEIFSIEGVKLIKQFARENSIPYKVIFNQVNSRTHYHNKIIQEEVLNDHVMENTIRNTIVLAEAFEHAQSIFNYKSQSTGADDFSNLADELLCYM